MMGPHIIKRQRRGYTFLIDTERADRLATLARKKLTELLAMTPEHDKAGRARALVQEAVRADEDVRGVHEARAWAAKQARAA